jgi:fido (protein-threonine AMPylation protein)
LKNSEKGHKKKVLKSAKIYRKRIGDVALNADKWQNKDEVNTDDKNRDKKSQTKTPKVAAKPRRYKLTEESVSKESSGLGGKVYGVREGTGKYGSSKGTPQGRADSTRPIDSTRYLETAQGTKTYSEVAEILAVSVAKTIETIINGSPENILITPEWICKTHNDIAGSLFPDWAGRFRDINVLVGIHIPPPYYEVPVHMQLYCKDLTARLLSVRGRTDIEKISETLAYADWRFQWIHPFKDFNGRVGRILLSAMLFMLKLPPAETASVDPEGKKLYLKALHTADADDLSPLTEIWVKRLLKAVGDRQS